MKQIIAIAEANHRRHRDAGGGIDQQMMPLGSATKYSMDPMQRGRLDQYGQLSNEKLREMMARYGSSPQGALVQRLLRARMMGQQRDPQAGLAGPPQPPSFGQMPTAPAGPGQMEPLQAQARGGGIRQHFAVGGDPMGLSSSMASPWWERAEERQSDSGFLHGDTLGRQDHLMATAPSGAYIIPADVVAGLGEGNSLAGARIMDEVFKSGPWGITTQGPRSRGLPEAHAPMPREGEAKGGHVQGRGIAQRVPVALSHGEYQVSPEQVRAIGRGNIKLGHDILDHWVAKQRKHQIGKLKKLAPPVGSKLKKGIAA